MHWTICIRNEFDALIFWNVILAVYWTCPKLSYLKPTNDVFFNQIINLKSVLNFQSPLYAFWTVSSPYFLVMSILKYQPSFECSNQFSFWKMRKNQSIYITDPNSVEFRKKTIDIAWFSSAQALHIFHRSSELSLIEV